MPRPLASDSGVTATPSGINGILQNGPCVAGFVAFFIAQSLKVLTHWYSEGRWDFTRVIGSGGMPSSHTACVVALTTALGTISGTETGTFAIGLVLSLVVMYDASGVRLHAGKQATVLNIIISQLPADHPGSETMPLRDRLGHTPRQVAVGALLGVVTGYLLGITWHGFGMPSGCPSKRVVTSLLDILFSLAMSGSNFMLSAVKKVQQGAPHTAQGVDLEAQKKEQSAVPSADATSPLLDPDEHDHFSQRAPWLRAGVLGATDGLVSVASLMVGVGGGSSSLHLMILSGLAGLVGGALSMAVGEYISVASQKDAEQADIEKEKQMQAKGPAARQHELEELAAIYESRGVSKLLAKQVAIELTETDVIRAHARDELGIDIDDLSNPLKACVASAFAFLIGAGIPLLAASFITRASMRLMSLILATTAALIGFGSLGAWLGGASMLKGGARVVVGGWIALAITYGIGRAFGANYHV